MASHRVEIRWLLNAPEVDNGALWDDCPPVFAQDVEVKYVDDNERDLRELLDMFAKWVGKNIED